MKKNMLLKYILCMLISANLLLGSVATAESAANHAIAEEAKAYLPIVSEYLGLGVLEYATILDMDGNGTQELITMCGEDYTSDENANIINLDIWQQSNGVAKKTLSKQLSVSQNAIISLLHMQDKYVILYSTGAMRQGNISQRTEVFNANGTENTFGYYISPGASIGDGSGVDFSELTSTPQGMDVTVNEHSATPADYAKMEKNYSGGRDILEGYGTVWVDLGEYSNYTSHLISLRNTLDKQVTAAISSVTDISYPKKVLNVAQKNSYVEKLEMIRDVVNYGEDTPLKTGYNKNDDGVFKRFELGFLESIDYDLYGQETKGEFAYYSSSPWGRIDPLIRERFGVEPDHSPSSMCKDGYYYTLFSRSSVFGASFSEIEAFQISDKLTLVSAICQINGPMDIVEAMFPVQMVLHHTTVNGRSIDQIYAYYENQTIPQSVIDTFVSEEINVKGINSKVLVNGKQMAFDAYNINGNNYFKLRDVAKVISGSNKQFEVTWDGSKNAINLISNKAYTVVGGEMEKGDGTAKDVVVSKSKIYLNGKEVNLAAYTINGNNYFKLRDLGETFNFNVSWDGVNNIVKINTSESYTPD